MSIDPQRARTLFNEALDRPADGRAAWLADVCDGELKARVEALLAAHDAPASVLDPVVTGAYTSAPPSVKIDLSGSIVAGKYKLLQKIGEGGMGDVYMADQSHPVKRRVAVKVIKAGMDSGRVLARFEAERQALALMDHPNIARVLDAGTLGEPGASATGGGSPFFVMELVKGIPLTQFCDEHKLPINDRLNLFIQICSAVQHAHQKGIIHRDLKPTNILVESHDGKPVPKVIDFGLAKATSGIALTEHSLFTAFGTVAGTPLYMAPEQANFNAIDVDTRSDIYSLGVILYELLTGTTPIERETLKKKALDEVMRVVREDEPPTPSSRLSHSESTVSAAATRGMEPLKLGRFVKGELDWIVMKALSKERERRYETANGFAKDVERFLNHEPVVAGPPSHAYKLRKFVQRNRGQVIAAGLVVFALVAGIAGTAWQAIRVEKACIAEGKQRETAEENERKADAAKVEAQAKEAEANAVVTFFEDKVFAAARPKGQAGGLGVGVTLRDAITASVPALEKGFTDQPLVEARLRHTLGKTFLYLAEHDQALVQNERARALFTLHRGADHLDTLKNMNNVARSYDEMNRPADALKLREETLAIMKRVLPPDNFYTLMCMQNLATSYFKLRRPDEGLKLCEETLAIQKRVLPPDHPETLRTMQILSSGYAILNRPTDALKLREEVLAIQKRVLPSEHPDTLTSMYTLASAYQDLNRHAEALKLFEEVLEIRKRVLPKDHPETLMTMMGAANNYAKLNRSDDALKLREETLAIQKRVLPTDHPNTLMTMMGLANSYDSLNRPADALKLREEVLAIQKRILPPDDPSTLRSMHNLAMSYGKLNRHDEALKLFEEATAKMKRVLPPDHPDTLKSMNNLAVSYSNLNRHADAVKLHEEVLAIRKRVLPPDHPDKLWSMNNLAQSYATLNRHADALTLREEVLEIRKRVLPSNHRDTLWSMNSLSNSYAALNRHTDALTLREEVLAIQKRVLPKNDPDTLASMINAAISLNRLDRGAEAIPLVDEFLKARPTGSFPPQVILDAVSLRMKHFQKAGDSAGCRATAELWEKRNQTRVDGLYNAACFRAITTGVQAKTPGADTAKLAQDDADRAMEWLHKAVKAGYKDAAHLKKDADLDALRGREDFKKLIGELEMKYGSEELPMPKPKSP